MTAPGRLNNVCVCVYLFKVIKQSIHSKLRAFGRTNQIKKTFFFSEPKKKIRLFLTAALFNKASELCYRQTRGKKMRLYAKTSYPYSSQIIKYIYRQIKHTQCLIYAQRCGNTPEALLNI